MSRFILTPLVALALACAPALTPASARSDDDCRTPERRTAPLDSTMFPALAGVWDIRYMTENSQPPGWTWKERIVLWENDERHARRQYSYMGGSWRPIPWRPLAGVRVDTAVAHAVVDSLLVDNAQVELTGGMLVVYSGPKLTTDLGSSSLVLHDVGVDAFSGYWTSDMGLAVLVDTATGEQLPNPRGWFCARRIGGTLPRPREVHYHDDH